VHLNENHIEFLLELIDTWNPDVYGGLTWTRVRDRFEKKFAAAPTDRTLRNHGRIKARFNQKKESIRKGGTPVSRKPSSLAKAAQIVEKLEAKAQALEIENHRLVHKLVTWQKNAVDFGMMEKQLNKPLYISQDTKRNLDEGDQ